MDNHWVGHSAMKPVDAESFQIRQDIKEVDDEKNDNFDMEILEKGALEQWLNVKKKTPYEKTDEK